MTPRALEPGSWPDAGALVDEVLVDRATARVYAEGWQSWSPTTWRAATATAPGAVDDVDHLMHFRGGTPLTTRGSQGEGLVVVVPGGGAPARCYGGTDPVDVPTIRTTPVGDRLLVHSTGPLRIADHADAETALAAFGDAVGAAVRPRPPPTVWCSWYRYFEEVTAAGVLEALRDLDRHDLAVDVVQVDDGWTPGLGEGLRPAERFGSLDRVVDEVRATGRRAGLWLAPFVVGADTTLARDHPEWLVGPAGRNWGTALVGLDLTHPGVQDLIGRTLGRLVDLGVDYLKLDFLYAGAVPGRRREDVGPVAAYRAGLVLVRELVGPEVYLVGCGAPLLPSVGLLDAMRVSPDTFHPAGRDGSAGLPGLTALAARAWQQGRLWVNDPDCVVASPSFPLRERWARAAQRLGGLPSFSDRPAELDPWGMATVRELMTSGGRSAPFEAAVVAEGAALAWAEGAR